MTAALITTRDGIVGRWKPPGSTPTPHPVEDRDNLRRWEPWVSDSVFTFEVASRLGFSTGPGETVSVWHLRVDDAGAGAPPVCGYEPLARFDRPTEATFKAQLDLLAAYADLRPDRAEEILAQMDAQAPFLGSIAFLRPDSKRWTLTLIGMVMELARLVEQRVKHALACRRPIEYSPQVQPIILTPGHGSLPSGHATEAFATALVFWRLLREAGNPYGDESYGEQFMRLASRIAVNRTVAGVHFPIDTVAGALLGLTLADYFVARSGAGDRAYQPAHFHGDAPGKVDGAGGIKEKDFRWSEMFGVKTRKVTFYDNTVKTHPSVLPWGGPVDLGEPKAAPDDPSRPLEWLWDRAVSEWT